MTPARIIWERLSPGRQSLARDVAHAALDGASFAEPLSVAQEQLAAEAVALKLWFLLWEGRRS